MKKYFIATCLVILLGVGCTSTSVEKPDETDTDIVRQCAPLKFSSGEYLFRTEDAQAIRGGSWSMQSELFIDPEVPWLHCAYYMNEAVDGQIILQTIPVAQFSSADSPSQSVPWLGDRAVLEITKDGRRTLDIQKGSVVINVVCSNDLGSCTKEEYLKIGQVINARWP